ncbi:MAG: glycoside hydrolase family 2 [Lachnospiraceae bacterium]|nr:glycoside hydrolase family 2 [Lachnospiraceae bacterium]
MEQIDLSGEFLCAWNSSKEGYPGEEEFHDVVMIPGTTETGKIGEFHREEGQTLYLSRNYPIAATVFYKRYITIPEDWDGKQIELFVERTKKSMVYVDGVPKSSSEEMVAPARHLLGALSSGRHELVIAVDNDLSKEWFPSQLTGGHQFTEHTQTNWNGMLGGIFLKKIEEVEISDLKAIKQKGKSAVQIMFKADSCHDQQVFVSVTLEEKEGKVLSRYRQKAEFNKGTNTVHNICLLSPNEIKGWDEFTKALYILTVTITGMEGEALGKKTIQTGFLDAAATGNRLKINGRTVFLRGNVDCCIYPLTGFPPMKKDEWIEIFDKMKEYGMNHYRFHSWCPPEAAFAAADEMGIYLEIEMSLFAVPLYEETDAEYDSRLMKYLYKEAETILKEFGHHPSLLCFAVGNELLGNPKAYEKLLRFMKGIREDKLYTQGANNFLEDPKPNKEDDVWITMRAGKGINSRASYSHNDLPLGHIQTKERIGTCADYKESIENTPLPLIVHEVGQYQFYPNYKEQEKYTGVTCSTALAYFKQKLKESGMMEEADAFYDAAGKLAVLCYKEELEAFMRTDGLTGFQLLGLQDFPGQGTALVGVLDSFLDSKGFISPKEWRTYCSETVLLGKFPSYVYEYGDEIPVEVVLHHFGAEAVKGILTIRLTIDGNTISEIHSESVLCMPGQNTSIGTWKVSTGTGDLKKAARAVLSLSFADYSKEYPLFLYPNEPLEDAGSVIVSSQFTESEKEALNQGKTVFIASDHLAEGIEGFFPTDFWCYPMFKEACLSSGRPLAPGTMGLLIDNTHPALSDFPTDTYSEWQWQQLTVHSTGYILDTHPEIKPIVQVIDNIFRNHKIGLLFEAPCKKGRLLICGIDLLNNLSIPEFRQLYNSTLRYLKQTPAL